MKLLIAFLLTIVEFLFAASMAFLIVFAKKWVLPLLFLGTMIVIYIVLVLAEGVLKDERKEKNLN